MRTTKGRQRETEIQEKPTQHKLWVKSPSAKTSKQPFLFFFFAKCTNTSTKSSCRRQDEISGRKARSFKVNQYSGVSGGGWGREEM